jgi:hypothetical protein
MKTKMNEEKKEEGKGSGMKTKKNGEEEKGRERGIERKTNKKEEE